VDLSSSANNATGHGTYRANAINGKPAIEFNGTTNYYSFATPVPWIVPPNEEWVFIVAKLSSGAGGHIYSSYCSGCFTYWWGKSSAQQGADAADVVEISHGTHAPDTNWHQANMNHVVSTSWAYRIDRTGDGSGPDTSSGAGTDIILGRTTTAAAIFGDRLRRSRNILSLEACLPLTATPSRLISIAGTDYESTSSCSPLCCACAGHAFGQQW
jgi:hypothetical protein